MKVSQPPTPAPLPLSKSLRPVVYLETQVDRLCYEINDYINDCPVHYSPQSCSALWVIELFHRPSNLI